MKNKKLAVIACGVLALDIRYVAQKLGLDVAFKFLPGGLHASPNTLREKLQAAIDEISAAGDCERIAIGYGICGRGTIGIQARNVPLAMPKVHDCIALFLGGDAAYRREFNRYPGTYYVSAGWCEENTEPMGQRRQRVNYGEEKLYFDDLVERYGERAARETFRFLSTWQQNYQRAALIETEAGHAAKYEQRARDMASEYGWKYEKIQGDSALIRRLLTTEETDESILVVPPEQAIVFDAIGSTVSAQPIWATQNRLSNAPQVSVVEDDTPAGPETMRMKIGLGIDAGGTYTDTVIYDLEQGQVLCKSKALTTKWDFTQGIGEALAQLDQAQLGRTEMVALSTTLATNAIVEGDGQKVGLIIMPPYGLFKPQDIPFTPKAVVAGQLEISGQEIQPVDAAEIERIARQMVAQEGVEAFAVSGFASTVNPAHELTVKRIIRESTGLFVTCGHELSDILNFRVRAHTATLNARIIPRLTRLLMDLEKVLGYLGIHAPIVVVKGDGTLMSAEMARERPVETILSGPAASVAGARHLTGLEDALVVDMGGTTTDTAALKEGTVSVCDSGSDVGGYKTHVKALEIRTAGLGGDSLIDWEKGAFCIGPRRVAPMAWLGAHYPKAAQALVYPESRLKPGVASLRGLQILALNGSAGFTDLTAREQQVVDLLRARPYTIDELVKQTGVYVEGALGIQRLEERFIVQRCGLTPTDLLHITGRFERWDRDLAERCGRLMAGVARMDFDAMAAYLLDQVVERLALELLKRQLDDETDPEALHACPVCRTLTKNMLAGGNDHYAVTVRLKRPVVGIGAPIAFFLPRAAEVLGAQAIVPKDADVANAIGAITSNVLVKRQVRIIAAPDGGYRIQGLVDAGLFRDFDEADAFARTALVKMVRDLGQAAGTSRRRVELETEDQLPTSGFGTTVFLGRLIRAQLRGMPDMVLAEGLKALAN